MQIDEAGVVGPAALPAMTDDQLKAELGKFTKIEIQMQQQTTTKVHPKLKCVLCCQRDFKYKGSACWARQRKLVTLSELSNKACQHF